MTKQSVTLSQCMIVKDEEANIERALSWGKGIVCEQIVVDTGSADRTVELAQKMGAKVLHFSWIDDFSAAKNFAIEQAKGDWIAFLDADEFFPEEEAAKILPLLRQAQQDRRIDIIRSKMAHLNEQGNVTSVFCQDRIFRNIPKLRYRYRIHEELYYQGEKRLACYDAQKELMILHVGYGRESDLAGKGARNAELLERDLQDNPKDGKRIMYLGDAYCIADQTQKALECYRRVLWEPGIDLSDDLALARAGLQIMALRSGEPAEETRQEYLQIDERLRKQGWDHHPDLDFYMGFWHLKAGKMEEAASLFENALRKMEHYRGGDVVRMASELKLCNWVIAAAALQKGDLQKAVQFATGALQVDKYCPEGIEILLRAFLAECGDGAAGAYWQFLCKIYDTTQLKDMLFIRKFARDIGFHKLEECVLAALPPEVREQL